MKECQEAGLSTRRSLHATKRKCLQASSNFVQIHQEVLAPQTRSFPHRRKLSWLKVRESQRRQALPAPGKSCQRVEHPHKPVSNELKPLAHEDQVRVIRHEAACSAEMNDVARGWAS